MRHGLNPALSENEYLKIPQQASKGFSIGSRGFPENYQKKRWVDMNINGTAIHQWRKTIIPLCQVFTSSRFHVPNNVQNKIIITLELHIFIQRFLCYKKNYMSLPDWISLMTYIIFTRKVT